MVILTLPTPFCTPSLLGKDAEGWPHWELIQNLPPLNLKEQEILIKAHVIHYFKTEVLFEEMS